MLAEVVLPRVKDFDGVHYVQSEKSGSVDFGFPGSAMSLFPQIEGPPDLFPPFHVIGLNNSQLRCLFNVTGYRYLHCDISDYDR